MSVFVFDYETASRNFREGRFSRWYAKDEPQRVGKVMMAERLDRIFLPRTNIHTLIRSTDSLFTIGSCFARRLERAAKREGMDALSLRTQGFLGKNIVSGYVNRYHTSAILNELLWANGAPYSDENFVETAPGKYVDPHSHPVVSSMSLEEVRSLRDGLTAYFAQIFDADAITITLGLIEGWFDKYTGEMLNLNPLYGRDDRKGRKLLHGNRFEFRVMSHEENLDNLEKIYRVIRERNPNAKIFVTVSPVPLNATFSGRDVAVANMLSKSMLRSCAESWIGKHPDIQYFPSYEMACMSDREVVFEADGMHIDESFVGEIMSHFMNECVEPPQPNG